MKYFLLLLATITLFACSSADKWVKPQPVIGDDVPYTRLTTLQGEPTVLEHFAGKNVALLFWATDCGGSRRAMRKFGKLARENKNRDDIVFIGVSVDKPQKEADIWGRIKSEELTNIYHMYSGNGVYDDAYAAYGMKSIPTAVLISPQGKVLDIGNSTIDLSKLN